MSLDAASTTDRPATTAGAHSRRRPTPVNGERPFGIEEIFFSTTDRKGIIRSSNHVFVRVSGYRSDELIGSPHNVIRHPDMPRAVFRLLWQEIEAGRPLAAYIKNLAQDGRHYWVMASVLPCGDGYLSIRIKPSTAFFTTAQAIYRELLALEQEVEQDDPRRRQQSIAVACDRLDELVRAAGYPNYDAFMRAALLAEVKSREAATAAAGRRDVAAVPADADPGLLGVLDGCASVGALLDGLVARLDEYGALYDSLAAKASIVLDVAEEVQFFSLNAQIVTPRMREEGVTLSAVAALMRARSDASAPRFQALTNDVAAATDLLGNMFFPVAATKLQAEAMTVFVREVLAGMEGMAVTAAELGALATCLGDGIDGLAAALAGLDRCMRALAEHAAQLTTDLKVMRALELNGRIEAAHASNAEAIVTLFRTIAEQVRRARAELDELASTAHVSFAEDAAAARRGREQVAVIHDYVAGLGAA